jgi:hypothetical protein
LKCELLNIANDKIRTHYWIPVLTNETYESSYYNDVYPDMEPLFNRSTVFFWRSTGFSAQLRNEYHPDLNDLRTFYVLFHTTAAKNPTLFNYWNLSSDVEAPARWWDSIDDGFWFDETTTMLT